MIDGVANKSGMPTAIPPFEWDPSNPSCLLFPRVLEDGNLEMARYFAVSDGTCADHELTALLRILTKHFEHHQQGLDAERYSENNQSEEWKDLSRHYRKAIKEAIDFVEDAGMTDGNDEAALQENDLLLHHISATLHLSEIFIPLTSSKWEHENPYDKPGYVTADTVRYLRERHGESFTLRNGAIFPDADIDLMYESEHPDKFRGDDGDIYWQYIEFLARTGRLEEAAALLLRHSLYTTAKSEDLKREFAFLCSLLLVAPIPGGRNRDNDGNLEGVTFGDKEYPMLEEGPTIADIGVEDFKHWETGVNQDIHFSSFAAVNAHRSWQDKIARVSLPSLQRYLPQEISELLNILSGRSLYTATTPALQLLEELLYKNPNWTPRKVAARASGLGMADYDTRIMHGDVLEALTQLSLGGSSSGAALPSTLYALVVSLYAEAEVLPEDWSSSGFTKTEILCSAAFDIITSLAGNHPDIGAQQGVRLLIPYALKEGKSEHITSIANILSCYKPSTEEYARTIISLCEPLITLKSVEVLEGCTDILLYIFRESVAQGDFEVAASVLTDGISLESKVYSNPRHGSCYKAMNKRCSIVTTQLCESLLQSGPSKSSESCCLEACSYLSVFDDSGSNLDLLEYPNVGQLATVWALFEAVCANSSSTAIADRVADCLNGPGSDVLSPRFRNDILSVLKKIIDQQGEILISDECDKPQAASMKPTKLKWGELSFGDDQGHCHPEEFERWCNDEFVKNVISLNKERAMNASSSRNLFGSTTDMKVEDNTRPFNELSESEKRHRVEYLNKRFVLSIE